MNVSYYLYVGSFRMAVALVVMLFGLTLGAELWAESYARLGAYFYWSGGALLILVLTLGKRCRAALSHLKFQSRVRGVLAGLGRDRQTLYQAALAMHRGQEERAMTILEPLTANSEPEFQETVRWLRAMSACRWLMRHRRVLSNYRERFPQLHALVFSHGYRRVPLRRQMLFHELEEARSGDLDGLANAYIGLVSVLISSLENPASPFNAQAEDLLEFLTGRVYVVAAPHRFAAWWKGVKPILARGGGALLVGIRLLQRECYAEALQVLDRLGADGLLTDETETVRRVAAFYALFARNQVRLSHEEIPRFFRDLHYHGCVEMGLLRYPNAETAEIVEGCRRGRDLCEAKKSFVEDIFRLWSVFGDELGEHLSTLLKRLLSFRGRKCPARLEYWKALWQERQANLDEPVLLLMDGVAAVANGQLAEAGKIFERVHDQESSGSTPLVNLVYLRLLEAKEEESRRLASEVLRRFPRDAGACVSLGRLFASHLEDIEEAENLFLRARDLDRSAPEPLILLGEVKLMQGRYAESQQYFDCAKQTDPGSLEARLGLARMYMETKRYELAVDNLQAVAREGRGDIMHMAHYHLYRTYRDMGDDVRAIEYLDVGSPGTELEFAL